MKRTIQFYEAPRMKVRQLRASRVLCQSGPGQRWFEGGGGTYNSDEQYDNGEY